MCNADTHRFSSEPDEYCRTHTRFAPMSAYVWPKSTTNGRGTSVGGASLRCGVGVGVVCGVGVVWVW